MRALELQTAAVPHAEVGALHTGAATELEDPARIPHIHIAQRVICPRRPDEKLPDLEDIRRMLLDHREKVFTLIVIFVFIFGRLVRLLASGCRTLLRSPVHHRRNLRVRLRGRLLLLLIWFIMDGCVHINFVDFFKFGFLI